MMKIGMNLLDSMPQQDCIKLMAELGFQATFTGDFDEAYHYSVANDLAKYGIEYETIHAPFNGINAMWGDDGEQMYARLTHTVDMCALSGAGIAIIHLSSGDNAPSINEVGMSRFTRLVEYASKKGVKIAFENQRKIANLAWALETFKDSDNVGFCWDCGHEGCFTPGREYMPIFGNQLICTHIHDNMGIYNGDDHMIPFDGRLNFDKVADHLRKSGYNGSLMLEVFPIHKMYENMSPEAFITRAAKAVRRIAVQ